MTLGGEDRVEGNCRCFAGLATLALAAIGLVPACHRAEPAPRIDESAARSAAPGAVAPAATEPGSAAPSGAASPATTGGLVGSSAPAGAPSAANLSPRGGGAALAPAPSRSAAPPAAAVASSLVMAPPVIRRRGPVASGESYDTWLETTGAYESGVAASVVVMLSAKAPFKCNTQYPYKLSLDAASGVTYPSTIARGMQVDGKHASMVVPFTPTHPGSSLVGGILSFSTCTLEQCLVEKARVSVAIDVR
jgi:hypothetical protein